MELDVRPEPSPQEREALVRALAAAAAAAEDRSGWWRAGIRENLGEAVGGEPLLRARP